MLFASRSVTNISHVRYEANRSRGDDKGDLTITFISSHECPTAIKFDKPLEAMRQGIP